MAEDPKTPGPAPRPTPKHAGAREDYGAPIDSFFEKQPPALRAILEELRRLILEAVPDVQSAIKWGNPFFTVEGKMVCAVTAHKAHVNLIVSGPADAFPDPEGRLTGESSLGRHMKLTDAAQIPRDSVLEWVRTAAERARSKQG